ncbi:MAG: hypothetical protein M0R80_03645 [Proteobacteria bacterium]|jgi:hypothetical protein|nr:hypothetical protein [Pseudomonadota bacterium]
MKTRDGFVSNSSSSSFVVKFRDEEEPLYLETEEFGTGCEMYEINHEMVSRLINTLINIKIRARELKDQRLIELTNEFTIAR